MISSFLRSDAHAWLLQEINKDVLVVGDFRSYSKENPAIDVQLDVRVEEPQGGVVTDMRARSNGQFAFTSKVSGEYKTCFVLHDAHLVSTTVVKLDWRMGVAATDWSSIAKKEHLDSMTVELRKVSSDTIYYTLGLLPSHPPFLPLVARRCHPRGVL